jgi:hypothetical protein
MFSASNLLDAQTILDDRFASHEMRMSPSPITALLLSNTPFMIGDHQELRTREDRPTRVNMMVRTKRATGNQRTHDHTGPRGNSMYIVPGYSTFTDTFSISLKQMDNNKFGFNEALANGLLQCMMNILEDVEVSNTAWLRAARTQYSRPLKGKVSFDPVTDSVVVTASGDNKARFFQLVKSALKQNNHKGVYDVITDNIMAVDAEFLKAQGGGNATNFGFQFSNLNLAESNELADANYPEGLVIAMPQYSACILPWIPKQNRNGWGNYNTYEGGYGAMLDPWGLGLEFAIHGYLLRSDESANNGDTQDIRMEFEVSIDLSRNKAPLSGVNNESTIIQVGLAA